MIRPNIRWTGERARRTRFIEEICKNVHRPEQRRSSGRYCLYLNFSSSNLNHDEALEFGLVGS